jgi:DtxR family Mn-dependent transcriptional regulator
MEVPISRRIEDYLRTVYEIVEEKGYARIKDVSKALGVKPSTVVEMMKKLHEQGLVIYEKYGGITLTPHGKEVAELVKRRHDVFKKFLEILLVPKDAVEKKVIDTMCACMGHPKRCPHGDEIPSDRECCGVS